MPTASYTNRQGLTLSVDNKQFKPLKKGELREVASGVYVYRRD